MLIIARFYKGNTIKSEEIEFFKSFDEFKREYAYATYEGDNYEMILYSNGYGVYDFEVQFAAINDVPPWAKFAQVKKTTLFGYSATRCECGANKVGSDRHSWYCPMFSYS